MANEIDSRKIFNGYDKPTRKIYLWGWDNKNNPACVILYGEHQFVNDRGYPKILQDDVTYFSYVVIRGSDGHFPSFEALTFDPAARWYSRNSEYRAKLFYKKDCNDWNRTPKEKAVKDYHHIKDGFKITIPFFEEQSYEQIVEIVKDSFMKKTFFKTNDFENFRLADKKEKVIDVPLKFRAYEERLNEIFFKPTIYARKKNLKLIMDSNPPIELYKYILKVGSGELISGLFLELAKRADDCLSFEAQEFVNKGVDWLPENYGKGVVRCAQIYLDAVNSEKREEKIMNLKAKIDSDFSFVMSQTARKRERLNLKTIEFKNILQQVEVYDLDEEIGKIACLVGTYNVYYYLEDTGLKPLNYFLRYLRRIIDRYSNSDEEKFIKILKTYFINYDNDYGTYLVNKYLLIEMPWYLSDPADYLKRTKQRVETKQELWDNHLKDVLEIFLNTKSNLVKTVFYNIIDANKDSEKLLDGLSFEDILKALDCDFESIHEIYAGALLKRLKNSTSFDKELVFTLLNCKHDKIREQMVSYLENQRQNMTPDIVMELMLLRNISDWASVLDESLNSLSDDGYFEYLNLFLKNIDKFKNVSYSKEIIEILDSHLERINSMSMSKKLLLFKDCLVVLQANDNLSRFALDFSEKIAFTKSYSDLKTILNDFGFSPNIKTTAARNSVIFAFLKSIKEEKFPQDSTIIKILEESPAPTLKIMGEFIEQSKDELRGRFSTLLILFESGVASFGGKVSDIFDSLDYEKQKDLHSVLMDSPNKTVYDFALNKLYELYEKPSGIIPEEVLLKMLEHSSTDVRAFISSKLNAFIKTLGNSNGDIFMYYVKTLLLLPNKISKSKDNIYAVLPKFVKNNRDREQEVLDLLLLIGNSNIVLDSERALVTFVKIKKEAVRFES